jgi:polyphosphate kinase 2
MAEGRTRLPRGRYEQELLRLQGELVAVQEWVRATGQRVVVIFEGRDAAGKGGTIKRIAEYLSPRVARIVALPTPTERERTQWYFQRYTEQLPAAGEIGLFDRSWYNRAGVERVMGYCTPEEYRVFLRQCPTYERMLVEDGILLRKYWFSVSDEEQERRLRSRVNDPMRQWKFSENDLLARARWVEFSRAKDEMFVFTDIREAPWYVIEADDKRHARINMISHLLESLPYERVKRPTIKLPPRPPAQDYQRPPRELFNQVPDRAQQLVDQERSETDKKPAKADKSAAKDGKKKARSGGKAETAKPAAASH